MSAGCSSGRRITARAARERLLAGASLRAADYLQAVRWRLALRDAAAAAFADIDLADHRLELRSRLPHRR